MVTLLCLVFRLLLSNKHLRLPRPGAAIMVTAYSSCFCDRMDPPLLPPSDVFSLTLYAFYASVSSCFSHSNSSRAGGEERGSEAGGERRVD